VQFRGTQWDAALASGEVAEAGEFTIIELSGNCLILARKR
jgi:hypothetical protein